MNEILLLDKLLIIKNKLVNNELLTNDEYKIFTSLLFYVALGIVEWSLDIVMKVVKK